MTQACRWVPVILACWEIHLGTMILLSPCLGPCEELKLNDDGLKNFIERMAKVSIPAL